MSGVAGAPRVVTWLRAHETPVWLWPPLVVVLTAWLSAYTDTQVVAYWLGVVAGCVCYTLALLALRPAPFAPSAAACVGVVGGLMATAILLNSTDHSLLRW